MTAIEIEKVRKLPRSEKLQMMETLWEAEMTTIMVNVRDDKKVNDVVRFLRDIDFLEVLIKSDETKHSVRRSPAKELMGTRILGDVMGSVVPESDWEALHEASS